MVLDEFFVRGKAIQKERIVCLHLAVGGRRLLAFVEVLRKLRRREPHLPEAKAWTDAFFTFNRVLLRCARRRDHFEALALDFLMLRQKFRVLAVDFLRA